MPGLSIKERIEIEVFRITIFKEKISEPDQNLFQVIFNRPPNSSRINNDQVSTITSEGIVDKVKYTVEENSQIIHVLIYGIDRTFKPSENPAIGINFEKSFELMDDLYKKLSAANLLVNIPRLALGPIFVIPAQTRIKGYEIIDEILPFNIDGTTSSDLIFQINKPVDKELKDGKKYNLNTVVNTSVAQLSEVSFVIGNDGNPFFDSKEQFMARIQFDVNNKPDKGLLFNSAEIENVYEQCKASICTVIENGVKL